VMSSSLKNVKMPLSGASIACSLGNPQAASIREYWLKARHGIPIRDPG
jgi:hypothetical protein